MLPHGASAVAALAVGFGNGREKGAMKNETAVVDTTTWVADQVPAAIGV